MTERIIQTSIAVLGVPALLVGYLGAVEWLLHLLPPRRRPKVRPWFWAGPALAFLLVFLVFPMLNTIYLSLLNARSTQFVGLENFGYVFANPDMRIAMRNTLLWLVFFTLVTLILGLLLAVLTDRVPFERVAKAIFFLPMAISFVAAGVIWRFIFDYRPPGSPQTGTLNAIWTGLAPSAQPQTGLINPATNTAALIFVGIWMWVGFCMVILSGGLKEIPEELLEAARIDGANEWRIFSRIIIPLLRPTIAVVATTMVINALKTFDIVYVMTNGNYDTDLIATRMYKKLFSARHFGHTSAIAVVLMLAVVPIMLVHARSFRRQEATQ
jgi:alpha-glucoside transport system permease protein